MALLWPQSFFEHQELSKNCPQGKQWRITFELWGWGLYLCALVVEHCTSRRDGCLAVHIPFHNGIWGIYAGTSTRLTLPFSLLNLLPQKKKKSINKDTQISEHSNQVGFSWKRPVIWRWKKNYENLFCKHQPVTSASAQGVYFPVGWSWPVLTSLRQFHPGPLSFPYDRTSLRLAIGSPAFWQMCVSGALID